MKAGWEIKPLAEVCDIVNGSTPLRSNKAYWENGSINWFTIEDIREQGRKIASTNQKITHHALEKTSIRILPSKSVLLCCTASIGEYAITEAPMATNQQFNGLVVKNHQTLKPLFLFYFCATLKDKLAELSGKTTIDFIPISRLRNILIPTPPILEQQRIVTILDEAFEGIATATANAKKNLANARELFESCLQSVFTTQGEGWVEKRLKELCEKITDGTHQTPTYYDDGVIFLSSRNVKARTIDWENIKYIDTKQHLEMHKRVAPRINDILLAKNGTTGVAAIVDRDVTFNIYVSLALLRALDVILPNLLLYFINSSVAKKQFNSRLKGSGVPNLHLEEIREVTISFPKSIAEQQSIVAKFDELCAETKKLEAIYQQKLTALEELKKSILNQAFSGQLS
ncbi:MAG: restriction endonuclease subunit S [Methylophilaceae bacterium]